MKVVHAKPTNKPSWAQTAFLGTDRGWQCSIYCWVTTSSTGSDNNGMNDHWFNFTFHFHFTNEQNTLHKVLKYYTYPQILCQEKRAQDMASPFMDCTFLQDLGEKFLDGLNWSVLRDHLHCLPLQNIHSKRRNFLWGLISVGKWHSWKLNPRKFVHTKN